MMELALFTGQMETLLIKLFFYKEVVVGRYFFTTQTVKFKLLNNLKIMFVMVYASNSVRMALLCFYLGTKMVKRSIMRVIPI